MPGVIRLSKRSKYNAKKTVVDGITFHSAKEAKRYQELKAMEAAGEICKLELQPKFELCVQPLKEGADPEVIGHYVADFQYGIPMSGYEWGPWVIEDVKGIKTALYLWKKNHFESQYGIKITEV